MISDRNAVPETTVEVFATGATKLAPGRQLLAKAKY